MQGGFLRKERVTYIYIYYIIYIYIQYLVLTADARMGDSRALWPICNM